MDSRDRIVRRWIESGDVVPFGRKPAGPAGPTIEIAGKKYALSDDGGPLGSPDDESMEGAFGGARLIRGPSSGKFKYLWVYDTDRQMVAMWRATDGNEKVWSPAKSEMFRIVRLDRKKQMNRVPHPEFQAIEAAMRKAADENLKGLQEWVEREKSSFQRQVDERVLEFFEHHVVPHIDRAVANIDHGATPVGFKPHNVDLPIRRQMVSFVISRILQQEFTMPKVEAYLKQHGLDPDASGHDNQAAQWAIGDVTDKMWPEYL